MKTIEVKFTTVLVIILALIALLLTIYAINTAQARYIQNKQIQIAYKTPDYYFDVTIDTTEISTFPATINVTVKNNNGTNYTSENLIYTIGLDNSNYKITVAGGTTRTLTGGSKQQETYAVTINKTGTDTSDKINLTFTVSKPYEDTISKELEIKTIPAYYGALVTNYSAGGVSAWRVFHKDEEGRVYLITDDYVAYKDLPTSKAGTALMRGSNNYKLHMKPIVNNNDYSGSDWIIANTNPNAQKLLSRYLTAYPTSTNNNMKAVAYMMDTESWSKFVDSTYAEYAIGGPTLDLFCASYKVTHPDRYIECNVESSAGYKVNWSDETIYDTIVKALKRDFNEIYIGQSLAMGMWIATPSCTTNCLYSTNWNGYIQSSQYNSTSLGFRPIVCLNEGVDIVSNGDGTYSIT